MMSPLALAAAVALAGPPEPVDETRLREVTKQVTEHDDFGRDTVEIVWRPKKKDEEESEVDIDEFSVPSGLSELLGTVLVWLLAAAGVAALIGLALSLVRARRRAELDEESRRPSPPDSLFGLDLRPESLPANIVAAAYEAWRRGERQLALSYLYRGALRLVLVREGLEVPASATEGECVTLVEERFGPGLGEDFLLLTDAWLLAAYGERPPNDAGFDGLVERWRPRFGEFS